MSDDKRTLLVSGHVAPAGRGRWRATMTVTGERDFQRASAEASIPAVAVKRATEDAIHILKNRPIKPSADRPAAERLAARLTTDRVREDWRPRSMVIDGRR